MWRAWKASTNLPSCGRQFFFACLHPWSVNLLFPLQSCILFGTHRWWEIKLGDGPCYRGLISSCGNGDCLAVALSTVVRSKLVPYLRKAAELFPGLQSMEEDFVSPSPRGASSHPSYSCYILE